MSVLEEAKERILSRLTELEPQRREYDELLAAATDLSLNYDPEAVAVPRNSNGAGTLERASRTRARSGSRRGRAGRKIAPAGQRKEQMLAIVNESPDGVTVKEVAAKIGLKDATALYRVQGQLVSEGAVRKDGAKMFPKAAPGAPAA